MSEKLKQIDDYERGILLELALQLRPANKEIFMRMYSHTYLNKEIEQVVADMPSDKVKWAIQQCERTVNKYKTES